MALLGRLLLLVLMAAGPAIAASPMDDHTQQSPPGHRRLLATMPGRPSVTGIGTVGPTTVMYVDVTPPTSNGSSPITAYEVTGTPVGGLALGRPTLRTTGMGTPTTGVNSRRFTFVNYPRGVAYRFTVRALNRAGPSPASMTSTAFTTPKLGVPGPPMVTLTRLPAGVYLDVTPPTQGTASVLARPLTYTVVGHPDGGATAQRPRIVITGAGSLVPAGQAGAGSSSLGQQPGRRGGTPPTQSKRRFRITGHLPNTVYRFAVSAANSAGVGPESVQRIVFYECKNGFKDNGTGCKCPAILNCDGFMKDSCACSKCKPYHTRSANGSSCTCNIARTNCQTVAKDGCSCQACKAGWTSDGSGGCTKITGPSPQCAPLANCKTYSQVDCKCTQCNPGWGNCDNNSTNGCETRIDSPTACGSCNTNCTLANATPRCDSGTCQVASCARGWGNCDNNSTNGCETPLNTPSNCGSCNTTCALPQATATCATGTCQVDSCDAGWGNCDNNSTNGCETPLNTTSNCGSCNTACDLPQATASCATGTCQVDSCDAGWDDCDANPDNGCEASLSSPQHCGRCTSVCKAGQLCLEGRCVSNAMAWGYNEYGALGDNSTIDKTTPVSVAGGVVFSQISAGGGHTCGLNATGHAFCWGGNMFGVLGDNSNNDYKNTPTPVAGGIVFSQISAGGGHTCGLNATGHAFCWGCSVISIYCLTFTNTPVSVAGGTLFSQISAGYAHTCGLNATGHAFCWGDNRYGQLGYVPTVSSSSLTPSGRTTPVSVAGGTLFSQISAGYFHTCGLNATGHAFCWGYSAYGELGNDSIGSFTFTPVSVAGGIVFSQISAGGGHTCGLNATGHAFCWGWNRFGQLGDTSTVDKTTPVSAAGGIVFSQISAGYAHTCGLNATGHAFCWGSSSEGRLGDNSTDTIKTTPVSVAGGTTFNHISAGSIHTAALAGWGAGNEDPGIGCETRLNPPQHCGSCAPCSLPHATAACVNGVCTLESCYIGWGNCDGISTNGCETPLNTPSNCGSCNTTCALPQATATCATGTCQVASCDAGWGDCDHPFVLSWGQNSDYQLGDGTTTSRSTPASVSASIFFQQISAGFTHTCGLDRSGSAFCWGSNVAGRLGKSYILRSETPDTVSGDVKFRMISAGNAHTCGLEQSSGHAFCWGSQFVGGGTMFGIRSEPVIVDGGISFAQISAGGSHTCGIESGTGLAWCWGRNSNGQLGIAAIGDRNTPTSVFGDLTFAQISAGDAHTCGLESLTGKAFCWGSNEFGRLGNGTTGGSVNTPVSVAGGFSFSQISAGATHTCAIEKVSGRAFCWGWNVVAQLGNNAVGNSSSTPISVSGGTVFTHIDAGAWHNCGLTTTGEAFCWGENVHGELGDGTNANQYAPVRVFGDTVFKQISAGWWHTVALAGWGTGNEDPGNGCETPLNTPQHCGSCAPCSLPHATADCVNGVCAVASCDAGWGDYDNDDANGCETLLETN